MAAPPFPSVRPLHPKVAEALSRFDQYPMPRSPRERLPLLDWLVDDSRLLRGSLAGRRVLFIQHHLGPLPARLAALERLGLDRSLCHFVDIPYSTNPIARTAAHRGVPVDQVAPSFNDPLYPYFEAQNARVMAALRCVAELRRGEPFVVVDDGGYFPRALQTLRRFDPRLAESFRKTSVVEQTTRGHRAWEADPDLATQLGLPVVSIALSRTKEDIESPFIGASTRRRIEKTLPLGKMGAHRTLVLGYGRVGRSVVASLLEAGLKDVTVVDPAFADPARSKAAARSGLKPVPRLPEESTADLVVGCTGRASLRPHQRRILADGATLVSCSSAAVEFHREGFVELADDDPHDGFSIVDPERARRDGIRATLHFRDGPKGFSFLHAGFPVNFDGALECVPAPLIQATHALLVAATFESLRASPGVHTLSGAVDEAIGTEALNHLAPEAP